MDNEQKVYKWEPDDNIVLTGEEVSVLYNGLAGFMNSVLLAPRAILGIADAEITLKSVIDRMIQQGIAKEISQEANPVISSENSI